MTRTIQLHDLDPLHGGHVEISLPWTGPAPGGCPLVIRRGTMKDPFLGTGGWQGVEHFFLPDRIGVQDGRLCLVFGPQLVDNALRDDDLVRMSLPEAGVTDVVAWRGITRSVTVAPVPRAPRPTPAGPLPHELVLLPAGDRPDQLTVLVRSSGPLPADLVLRISRDGSDPELGPDGWGDRPHSFTPSKREDGPDGARLVFTLPAGAKGGPVVLDLAGSKIPAELPQVLCSVPSKGGRRGVPAWLAVFMVLVLLALAGGSWWWFQHRQAESASVAAMPDASTQAADTATPDAVALPSPSPPVPAAQAAYDRARAAIQADNCPAARRDMLTAVQGDYGPALLAWAEGQDSLDFRPCLTETQNDISALSHLKRACTAHVEGAKAALERLTAELTRRAGQGDDAAQDVLRLAVPDVSEACNG